MTDFSQTEQPPATPGTAGAVAPPPVESEQRVGGGALMQRLSDTDAV
ncbi:MAG TPA: hypothetical protein VL595_05085 [Pseudonocardia sp.]|jgi:hypothetical protein|nr:hypothetical protein [Pseudonocardia sp.]HVE27371.1 hypothetical protein [Sporichthya sp.]